MDGRRARLIAAVGAVAATLLPMRAALPDDGDAGGATAPELSFAQSGLMGGGFQNVIALHDGVLVSGGDVSGFHRSADGGEHWDVQNRGFEALGPRYLGVADIAFSDAQTDVVYACTTKGMYSSSDAALTWKLLPASPTCLGGSAGYASPDGGPVAELPFEHPRSTGDLIVETANGLIVGSFDHGVMASQDGGNTWSNVGLAPIVGVDGSSDPFYIRSLVADPRAAGSVYVGTYNDGVWKLEGLDSALPTATRMLGAPATVEELRFVGDTLFAAAGASGVYKTSDGGATWGAANTGLDVGTAAKWISLDGFANPDGSATVYVGSSDPARGAIGQYRSVMKSVDSGATWHAVTADPAGIHGTIGGPDGPTWWLYAGKPSVRLGQASFVAAQVLVDPAAPDVVYVAGRSGVWKTSDGGANWYPCVQGLGVTGNRALAVNPADPNGLVVGSTDWIALSTYDGARTVALDEPPRPTGPARLRNMTLSMASDASRVYAGVGYRDDNVAGGLWSRPFDASAGWVDEGLFAAAGGGRPAAVMSTVDAAGTRVLLVAVQASGVWRKGETGVWQRSASAPDFVDDAASFADLGGGNVFVYDHIQGVYRSSDYGVTWTRIWAVASKPRHTGYLLPDPHRAGSLYASTATGLFRLRDATGDALTVEIVADVPRPGPLAVAALPDGAAVYAASLSGISPFTDSGLYRTTDGGAWTDVADDQYRRQALMPNVLAAGSDGRLYVALDGNGLLVGLPPNPTPPTTTTTTTATSTTTTSTSTTTSTTTTRPTTTTTAGVDRVVQASDTKFDPAAVTGAKPNLRVAFSNVGTRTHGVRDTALLGPGATTLFNSGDLAPNARWDYRFTFAGTFAYGDPAAGYSGTARLPFLLDRAAGGVSTVFTLTLSTVALPSHLKFDVQVRKPGASAYTAVATSVATPTFKFTPNGGTGSYSLRARVHTTSNRYSGWSPIKTITVS